MFVCLPPTEARTARSPISMLLTAELSRVAGRGSRVAIQKLKRLGDVREVAALLEESAA
ncbi:hypothetical protein [Streptomyces piniterrae]|uniref:hypothetical protein n=1 Tax=Streptomyces piniterrae TaxID=2571125 RepID=UPI00145EDE9B|nr:hypothetical protein [Streptomyces piniterrae]